MGSYLNKSKIFDEEATPTCSASSTPSPSLPIVSSDAQEDFTCPRCTYVNSKTSGKCSLCAFPESLPSDPILNEDHAGLISEMQPPPSPHAPPLSLEGPTDVSEASPTHLGSASSIVRQQGTQGDEAFLMPNHDLISNSENLQELLIYQHLPITQTQIQRPFMWMGRFGIPIENLAVNLAGRIFTEPFEHTILLFAYKMEEEIGIESLRVFLVDLLIRDGDSFPKVRFQGPSPDLHKFLRTQGYVLLEDLMLHNISLDAIFQHALTLISRFPNYSFWHNNCHMFSTDLFKALRGFRVKEFGLQHSLCAEYYSKITQMANDPLANKPPLPVSLLPSVTAQLSLGAKEAVEAMDLHQKQSRQIYLCCSSDFSCLLIVYYTQVEQFGIQKRIPRVFQLIFDTEADTTPVFLVNSLVEWKNISLEPIVPLENVSLANIEAAGLVILNRFDNLSIWRSYQKQLIQDIYCSLSRLYGVRTADPNNPERRILTTLPSSLYDRLKEDWLLSHQQGTASLLSLLPIPVPASQIAAPSSPAD